MAAGDIAVAGKYTASGTIENRQNQLLDVKAVGLSQRNVIQNQTVTTSRIRDGLNFNWDPLAQTFAIPADQATGTSGVYVTSVGLFFATKPTNANEFIKVQIRNVVNGYPGSVVLTEKTVYPGDSFVNVDNTKLIESTIVFPCPIFLDTAQEFCLVLMPPSGTGWNVWVSRMGDKILNQSNTVTSQPSTGSLFKSQNSSTWTADQLEDLTFVLYKARFDISKSARVTLNNAAIPEVRLSNNALESKIGSGIVRVRQNAHGLSNGDYVQLRNVTSGPFSALGTYLSGADASLRMPYVVSGVEYDSYLIDIGVNATYSGYFGGTAIWAESNIQYSTIMPNIVCDKLTGTDVSLTVDALDTSYNFDPEFTALNREDVNFSKMMLIASSKNEAVNSATLGNSKSFKLKLTMTSQNANLSPFIDRNFSSLKLIRNKINNPTEAGMNSSTFDSITLFTTQVVKFDYNTTHPEESFFEISSTVFTTYNTQFDKISVGKYVYVENDASTTTNKTKLFLVTKIERSVATSTYRIYVDGNLTTFKSESTKTATLILKNRFVDVIASGKTSIFSSYIAKPITLKLQSSGVRVTFDYNAPIGTYIDVYYRKVLSNDYNNIADQRWYQLPVIDLTKTKDFFNFTEATTEVSGIPVFDKMQIKLVFRSDNPALTPRIKNLRMLVIV